MKPERLVKALTIAGSDSGGGAGIQADLKTFEAAGVYGASVITAITAQDTEGVKRSFYLPPDLVADQIDAVMDDIAPSAAKTGMLGETGIINAVVAGIKEYGLTNLVVDPVMAATSGDILLDPEAVDVLQGKLLPLALIVTPNLDEASLLAGFEVSDRKSIEAAARSIREMGPRFVVIKGGHRPGDADDYFFDGRTIRRLASPRLTDKKLHGTGCTFSAAIAAGLAQGREPLAAVTGAKAFMNRVLKNPLTPGRGAAVVNWKEGRGG